MSWLEQFWTGLTEDVIRIPDGRHIGQIVGRSLIAALLGGVLGYEREQKGKAAGMRTHMVVALAAAFFVIVPHQMGMPDSDVSRVVQGLAAGVGFLGAGAIIKQTDKGQVLGLTTAAGLYFTTAIGVAAGIGHEMAAILGTVVAFLVIRVLPAVERLLPLPGKHHGETSSTTTTTHLQHDVVDAKHHIGGNEEG